VKEKKRSFWEGMLLVVFALSMLFLVVVNVIDNQPVIAPASTRDAKLCPCSGCHNEVNP